MKWSECLPQNWVTVIPHRAEAQDGIASTSFLYAIEMIQYRHLSISTTNLE